MRGSQTSLSASKLRHLATKKTVIDAYGKYLGKKIVQISDVHLGHVLRQDFLWDIVDKINSVNPEFVCIT